MHSKKSGLLLTLQTLEKYSDEDHPLTQAEISRLIREKVSNNNELIFDRKTIHEYIEILKDDFDYEIIGGKEGFGDGVKGKRGFALINREFDLSQVQVLMDSLFSSKFIPTHAIKEYRDSIFKHLSIYAQNDAFKFIEKTDSISRSPSPEIFLNAEEIITAIRKKKDISFKYKRFNEEGKLYVPEGEPRTCTPFYLVNNFGNYYMVCASTNKKVIRLFKVNYMTDVQITTKASLKKEDVKGLGKDFDITQYLNENVYLYGTDKEPIDAEILIIEDPKDPNKLSSSIAFVKEWFGNRALIERKDGKTIFKVKCSPDGLKFWLFQFGLSFEVLKPKSLREEVVKNLKEILNRYTK